jgi:4-amino-4-deoxy-L-arabinose transferase-like glycosyltransferase
VTLKTEAGVGRWLLLAGIGAAVLCFRLGALPFVGADEPRYARVAEEMHASGDRVTPRLEGRPWLEKPPLYYWITLPFIALLGPGETAARLGPAAAALVTVLATFALGRGLVGAPAAFSGALILATSLGFVVFGRSASTDIPLTACLSVSLALLGLAAVEHSGSTLRVVAGGAFLGLAALAKGPVAFALAAGVAVLFWWLDERRLPVRPGRLLLAAAAALAVAVPWYVLVLRANGLAFVSAFLLNHNLARFLSDVHHHSEPFYYYVPVVLGLLLPWTGWLPLLLPRKVPPLRTVDPAVLWLGCWAVFPLLFFSLSRSKLPGYVLPSLPPIALLLGRRFARGDIGRGPAALFLALSAAATGALAAFLYASYGMAWTRCAAIALALAVPAAGAFLAARGGKAQVALALTALAGALAVMAAAQLALPALGAHHSTREIARAALERRAADGPVVTFRFFHHTLHYYTGYTVAGEFADLEPLREFALRHPHFLVVARSEDVAELRRLEGFVATPVGRFGGLELIRVAHL